MTTPLDVAHAAMAGAPDDSAARLAFHARLVEAELFLLLAEEPSGNDLTPKVFALEDGPVILAFDTEARLAAFANGAVPYAAAAGRSLVSMLAGQGVGLGVNFDVAPSAQLVTPEVIDWLAATLADAPQEISARPDRLYPPSVPPALVTALDARLARAAGLARTAWLAGVTHADGTEGHLLVVVDPAPGAETSLARALAEAAGLAGVDQAGPLDVVFLAEGDPLVARLARVGLRFDLPQAVRPAKPAPPGSDPNRPPRLR